MKWSAPPGNGPLILRHEIDDWCHICGFRKEGCEADIWYAENAEHNSTPMRGTDHYVRMCADCADRIAKIARGEEAETRRPRSDD